MLALSHLVHDVDVAEGFGAVALVDGVNAQEARAAVGIGLATLADGRLGGLSLCEGGTSALADLGLAQIVEMAIGQARQTLQALLPEDLELAAHERPSGRP